MDLLIPLTHNPPASAGVYKSETKLKGGGLCRSGTSDLPFS